MKEKAIIFSPPMVRAVWDGSKTQTRRLLYSSRKCRDGAIGRNAAFINHGNKVWGWPDKTPEGQIIFQPDWYWAPTGWHKTYPDNLLWVRENFYGPAALDDKSPNNWPAPGFVSFAAHPYIFMPPQPAGMEYSVSKKLRPSLHLPQRYSRITLRVKSVKVEHLQNISDEDIIAEGIYEAMRSPEYFDTPGASDKRMWEMIKGTCGSLRGGFKEIWVRLNGQPMWDWNPPLVALSLKPSRKTSTK